ncbi:MAG: molecular chaperone HtpG, partial [Cyanobacteria bacterium P01_H01_bin.15]
KKSLYTDREIFLRELISNGVDAISKLKMVSYAEGLSDETLGEPKISIAIDKDAKTLSISDTGIGMTADEIKKYINQVAFSSAEEFISKYQKDDANALIGHFGLGFYSAFMVAGQVEIDTLSYKADAAAVHWTCDGSPKFELTNSDRSERGTTITLTLLEDEAEYLESARIKQLITTYCDFLPVPIYLDGEVVNKQRALWKESPQDLKDEDYLEFYQYLYPFQDPPLLWVHLKTDYPFLLNGIIYFPKLRPDVDVTISQLKLFCNQVFVSDNCKDIIPEYLLPLRGVIDSPDIPLNVSRSALTNDRTVRRIGDYISRKVGDRLKALSKDEPAEYIRCWQDVGTFVKYGSLRNDKFKKQVEDLIIFRTTAKLSEDIPEAPKVEVQTDEDDAWQDATPPEVKPAVDENGFSYTTLKDYLERNKERHENQIFYCSDPVAQGTYVELYKGQGLEVLFMDSFIDANYFIPFLERESGETKLTRVDSELDDNLLEKDQAGEIVDPTTNKSRNDQIKELFEKALNKPKVNIKVQALKSEGAQSAPPAMVLLPEAMRRLQEMTAMMQQKAMEFPEEHILVINSSHPLVDNLLQLEKGAILQTTGGESPSALMATMLCQQVYDLALMVHNAFDASNIQSFIDRSTQVMTQLTEK